MRAIPERFCDSLLWHYTKCPLPFTFTTVQCYRLSTILCDKLLVLLQGLKVHR